jgi:hypothetical protein
MGKRKEKKVGVDICYFAYRAKEGTLRKKEANSNMFGKTKLL